MKDKEFTKILDMMEFLHGEHLFMMNLMLKLMLKPKDAEERYEEIAKLWNEGFDRVRKDW